MCNVHIINRFVGKTDDTDDWILCFCTVNSIHLMRKLHDFKLCLKFIFFLNLVDYLKIYRYLLQKKKNDNNFNGLLNIYDNVKNYNELLKM